MTYSMSKKRLFALLVWSTTLAATGVAAEATEGRFDAETPSAATQNNAEDAALRRVLEQFRTTKVPLSQAIVIAEHLHDGSRTADISFEISGPSAYRIRTVKNETVWENVIDASTGRVTQGEIASSLKELDREDLAIFVSLKWIRQELLDAVRVAEESAAGRAVAGGLMKLEGKPVFVVLVASGDHLKEVMLEPPKIGRKEQTH